MRTEQEVLDQVMAYASAVPGIRAVVRTNLMPVRKYLYSYEFYFVVEKVEDYEADTIFEKCFGERILLYRGDRNYPDLLDGMKAHMMVYKDGITLVINAISDHKFREKYGRKNTENAWISGTFQVLLDKDGSYADVGREKENLLFYEVPDRKDFEGCCSEFFWVLKTCAEYVLRKEIPAAMFYLNLSVRDVLNRMIRWYICLKNKEPVELGILDSYLERYLPEEIWAGYCQTYACVGQASLWNALDEMTELFQRVGVEVAAEINTAFPDRQQQAMLDFIARLENMEL